MYYTGIKVDYFMSWPILLHSLFSLNKTNMSCSLSAIVNASKTDIYQWPPVFPQEWFIWWFPYSMYCQALNVLSKRASQHKSRSAKIFTHCILMDFPNHIDAAIEFSKLFVPKDCLNFSIQCRPLWVLRHFILVFTFCQSEGVFQGFDQHTKG